MDEILELLISYSKDNLLPDYSFVMEILEILTAERDLHDYIREVKFRKIEGYEEVLGESKVPASYLCFERQIEIDLDRFEKYHQRVVANTSNGYSTYEKRLTANSMILHALIHETEHANERKRMDDGDYSFEGRIIRICNHMCNEFLNQPEEERKIFLEKGIIIDAKHEKELLSYWGLKKKYLAGSPTERFANIHAFEMVFEILKEYGKSFPNTMYFLEQALIDTLIRYYDNNHNIPAPTERFINDYRKLKLSNTDEHFSGEFYASMNEEKETDLYNRLVLGLPISQSEHKRTENLRTFH